MIKIGTMIRSARMKATTPPKLIPPFHSTAASGTLPIEQTKLSSEMTGPITGPQSFAPSGCPARNRCRQALSGTQAPTAPAISKPAATSLITAAHSITKMGLTEGNPSLLSNQMPPGAVGHPGADRASDQQAGRDIPDHGRPLHHEDVADRGKPVLAQQPDAARRGRAPRRRPRQRPASRPRHP